MARLSVETWSQVRAERETMGTSFPDLANRFNISHQAIQKKSAAEGWSDGADVAEIIRRKVAAKVAGQVAGCNQAAKAAAIDAAVDRTVEVIDAHKREWADHRDVFGSVPGDVEAGKHAKIGAEMLLLRQKGERLAHGLDTTDSSSRAANKEPHALTAAEIRMLIGVQNG